MFTSGIRPCNCIIDPWGSISVSIVFTFLVNEYAKFKAYVLFPTPPY